MVKLMNRSLTALQRNVMGKGLSFPPTPTRRPLVDTIVAVEDGASQLKEENVYDYNNKLQTDKQQATSHQRLKITSGSKHTRRHTSKLLYGQLCIGAFIAQAQSRRREA